MSSINNLQTAFKAANEQQSNPGLTTQIPTLKRDLDPQQQSLMDAMDFEPLQQMLGDKMPDLIPGEVGRLRLLESLRSIFGEQFRNNMQAQGAIQHFDSQTSLARDILKLRGLKNAE
jgi:hypothetical protein